MTVADSQVFRLPHISRRRLILPGIVLSIILIVILGRIFVSIYTDFLWFNSVAQGSIFTTIIWTKVLLGIVFIGGFTIFAWLNIMLADKIDSNISLVSAEEVVIRYRVISRRTKLILRTAASLLLGILVGSAAISQWQNWLLFNHSYSFHKTDPLFHKDVSYYVFKLPFLSFLSGWLFVAVIFTFALVSLEHYLRGGIRLQGAPPRILPSVKAHLSFLLGLLALEKAFGYFYVARYQLLLSTRGVVQGASYTDVHVQLPAIELLTVISIASFLIFLINIYRQGWVLPSVAIILWAVIALVAGVIYPALIQSIKVQPSQSSLELPYIADDISATRSAYNLNGIAVQPYSANLNATALQISQDSQSLNDTRLWDWEYTLNTYEKLQNIKNYYQFTQLAYDRYNIGGQMMPMVVGIRQINSSGLPQESWVNKHLQYTHGYGAIISPANLATADGNPQFGIQDVPPFSQTGYPNISQPDVYFGVGAGDYVIVDSKQSEIDYEQSNGNIVESHYQGAGGVSVGSFFRRLVYSIKFGNFNILFSSLLSPQSKILYFQDLQSRIHEIAPFLYLDSDPYPVVTNNGQLVWIQDAYTATTNYPYSQSYGSAGPSALSPDSDLASNPSLNYVRNSVKVVINAYNGDMKFYVVDSADPIIRSWQSTFPSLFTPVSQAPADIISHFRYPEDLFAIQSLMFGRYHITSPSSFYSASDAWNISEAPSNEINNVNALIQPAVPINPNGRFSPTYQVMRLPGDPSVSFNLLEPYVPTSSGSNGNDRQQLLSSFLVARSDPSNYGQLTAYVTPRGQSINGPAIISALIDNSPNVSKEITLLSQEGSTTVLGTVMMLPIGDSLVYIRPLYVASSTNPIPNLKYVIAVYGTNVSLEPTLSQALADVFGQPIPGISANVSPGTSVGSGAQSSEQSDLATQYLQDAQSAYNQAQTDLKNGDLGAYQSDINNVEKYLQLAQQALAPKTPQGQKGGSTSSTSTSTTTTILGGQA